MDGSCNTLDDLLDRLYVPNKTKNVNLKVFNSTCDQSQIGIKLGAKHVMHQKLATFLRKKDIFVNRLESVIFGM